MAPGAQKNVIRTILGKAKHQTKVIYLPGNHDELLRDYHGMSFGNVSIQKEAIHICADARRYLVLHGDRFDGVVMIGGHMSGALDDDLRSAVHKALELKSEDCVEYARGFSWEQCARTFESNLAWIR